MADTVLLEAFSGEELFSSREVDINEYYDGDVPELDDMEFNVKNNISRLRITTPSMGKVDYNFYNSSGKPVKFITLENGRLTRAELCGESDEFFSLLQISYIAHEKPFAEVHYVLWEGAAREFTVSCVYIAGEDKAQFFNVQISLFPDNYSDTIEIPLKDRIPEGGRFYAEVSCGDKTYLL